MAPMTYADIAYKYSVPDGSHPLLEACAKGVYAPRGRAGDACPDCRGTGLVPIDPDRGFVVLLEALPEVSFRGLKDGRWQCIIEERNPRHWSLHANDATKRDALFAAVGAMMEQEGKQ